MAMLYVTKQAFYGGVQENLLHGLYSTAEFVAHGNHKLNYFIGNSYQDTNSTYMNQWNGWANKLDNLPMPYRAGGDYDYRSTRGDY